MKRFLLVIFQLFIFTFYIYSNDSVVIRLLETISVDNNEAKLFLESNVVFSSSIEIIDAYWVDMFGDNEFTEFFVVFSQYNGESVGVAIIGKRRSINVYDTRAIYLQFPMRSLTFGDEIIDLTLNSPREIYGFEFFEYNNNKYIFLYNKWLSTPFFAFRLYSFNKEYGIINNITIEENEEIIYDGYNIVNDQIFFYSGERTFILKNMENNFIINEIEY